MRWTPATRSIAYSGSSCHRRRGPQPQTQSRRGSAVALQAKRPHIAQIALPAALRYRDNMIGIPERFPAALRQSPLFQKSPPRRKIQPPHVAAQRHSIHLARRADSVVPRQNALAQISRIRAQFPFMHAGIRTKGAPVSRSLLAAPPAKRTPGSRAFHLMPGQTSAALRSRRPLRLHQRGLASPNPNSACLT